MQFLEPASEAEMVALFLKTEVESARFREKILALLEREAADRSLLDQPDLTSPNENDLRAHLLGEWRGYRRGSDVFTFYPERPEWWRCRIPAEEIPEIQYINDDYWVELSGGSRRLGDAARNIQQGIEVFGMSTEWARGFASAIAAGARPPDPILVTPDRTSPLTILEGHARLTASCLALEHLPEGLTALVGFGAEFALV